MDNVIYYVYAFDKEDKARFIPIPHKYFTIDYLRYAIETLKKECGSDAIIIMVTGSRQLAHDWNMYKRNCKTIEGRYVFKDCVTRIGIRVELPIV